MENIFEICADCVIAGLVFDALFELLLLEVSLRFNLLYSKRDEMVFAERFWQSAVSFTVSPTGNTSWYSLKKPKTCWCCFCPQMFHNIFFPWHIFVSAPASLAQFRLAHDNSDLNDSQPCFLTFHRIIMDLAADSSCVGTELQNSGGWSGNVTLCSPRRKGTMSPHWMCETWFIQRDQKVSAVVSV